jgi:hypothetical protein
MFSFKFNNPFRAVTALSDVQAAAQVFNYNPPVAATDLGDKVEIVFSNEITPAPRIGLSNVQVWHKAKRNGETVLWWRYGLTVWAFRLGSSTLYRFDGVDYTDPVKVLKGMDWSRHG